ncbi:SDR family oxidoreductase, partial [uncultured Muribaculum sp.]|uniref:SDR family oxidoreductase n=1 Tax=uncultured Muribaculum sp. TaxID=1918613 RepID=UPI0026702B17
ADTGRTPPRQRCRINETLRELQPDGSRHPFDQFIISKTPAARWGTPEDLMGPAVFLASDASNFVNGHVLYVDGGILAYIGKQPK